MCTGRVDLAQRVYERGEIHGRLIQIVDRAVGVLAGQPFVAFVDLTMVERAQQESVRRILTAPVQA